MQTIVRPHPILTTRRPMPPMPPMRSALATIVVLLVAALASAQPASATHQIPFHGSDSGSFTMSPPEGPFVRTSDTGAGHASHLGTYRLQGHETINTDTFAVTDGGFTLTAANGDTLVGTYEGSAAGTPGSPVITYQVTGPVTGGTGRFAGATGELTWDGIANLQTGLLSDTVSGWISLHG